MKIGFTSGIFKVEEIEIGSGNIEQIVRGGRDKFPLLEQAFAGIQNIGVIGWGSQGPAQAQNLRDSLVELPIKVVVGLQKGSLSIPRAEKAGFTTENGTLGEMFEVIASSGLVLLLISDAAQVEHWDKIVKALKPGATLGFSHGFLLGYLEQAGLSLPDGINVIGVCPKGMGPSVRRLYEQGKEINGAGINCSFAVERDIDGKATDIALAWALAIGAPYVFQTTLQDEYRSDIFGERGVLLGGVHGVSEALFRYFETDCGLSPDKAFRRSVENITDPISSMISRKGIIGVHNCIPGEKKEIFEQAYCAAYQPFYVLLEEIYEEVASGNEIRSVVMTGERLKKFPMGKIDGTRMWKIGEIVRQARNQHKEEPA